MLCCYDVITPCGGGARLRVAMRREVFPCALPSHVGSWRGPGQNDQHVTVALSALHQRFISDILDLRFLSLGPRKCLTYVYT